MARPNRHRRTPSGYHRRKCGDGHEVGGAEGGTATSRVRQVGECPREFALGKTMEALAEIQFAAGAPGEGVDVLMRVTGAEAGEDDFSCVNLVIVVGVAYVN